MNKKLKVLLVEDDKFMNEILRDYMASEGMYVDAVFSYSDAVYQINSESGYDILIVDYNLNKNNSKNGLEIHDKLKELNPGIKTIMISAYGNKIIKKNAYLKGIHYFLDKPFVLDELSMRILELKKMDLKNKM